MILFLIEKVTTHINNVAHFKNDADIYWIRSDSGVYVIGHQVD